MSFETGGDMQDPFQEPDEQEDEAAAEDKNETEIDRKTASIEVGSGEGGTEEQAQIGSDSSDELGETTGRRQTTDPGSTAPYVTDLDVTRPQSPSRLARALMMPDYHDENPPVPYAVWRDGTSTGRSRTTIELNSDVDELVKQALREFNGRYDADIHKADLREFALAYGLTHLDAVFEMAEEWGIQY